MRKLIVFAALFIFISFVWWIVSTFFWRGTVEFTNLDGVSSIKVDNNTLWLGNPKVELRTGRHEVEVSGPFMESYVEEINVSPLSTTKFTAGRKQLSSEELVRLLTRNDDLRRDYNVSNVKLLEDNKWLIFRLSDPEGKKDSTDYIYHYDDTSWLLIEKGTGLNYYTLNSELLPRSVEEAFDYR